MSYNGWSNRETWLVNIWFNPETEEDLIGIKEYLEDLYYEFPNVVRNFCSIKEINWNELAEALNEDRLD